MKRVLMILSAGATLLLLSPFSYGSFIEGSTLAVSPTGPVAVDGQYIDFDYSGPVMVGTPPIATGTLDGTGAGPFLITAGSTGSFAPLVGTTAEVHDLCQAGAGPCTDPVPTGTSVDFSNFITFSNGWSVTLTTLEMGTDGTTGCGGTPAAGQICTPTGSPFNLENQGSPLGVVASFAFDGTITDGTTTDPVNGNFTETLSGTNLQTILADLAGGEAIATSDASSLTITGSPASVPEPTTLTLAGVGFALIALGALSRRIRQ
jgi:hypothetical protein